MSDHCDRCGKIWRECRCEPEVGHRPGVRIVKGEQGETDVRVVTCDDGSVYSDTP